MPRRAHVGDVVAFRDPEALSRAQVVLMVRRVAALEGGALESSDPRTFRNRHPSRREHAWVVCDNPAMDLSRARTAERSARWT